MADVKPQQSYYTVIQTVEHISFNPKGGWFVRYHDGTVRLCGEGQYSEAFHRLAAPYMKTKNYLSKQRSPIEKVFFGAGESLILQLENRTMIWNGLPAMIVDDLKKNLALGHRLTSNANLCPWDSRYMFFEWEKQLGTALEKQLGITTKQHFYSWNVWSNGYIDNLFIREIVEGGYPVSHTGKKTA